MLRNYHLMIILLMSLFRNEEEKKKMFDWNLTAQTILSVDEWLKLFKSSGYTGDYYWFMP